jgi:hypothetical protein
VDAPHRLVVDPVLEDLAGNSALRVFDRPVAQGGDGPPPELVFSPTSRGSKGRPASAPGYGGGSSLR